MLTMTAAKLLKGFIVGCFDSVSCALQAHFFCKIQQNGYKVLYLSARAIGQVRTSHAVSFNTDRI